MSDMALRLTAEPVLGLGLWC